MKGTNDGIVDLGTAMLGGADLGDRRRTERLVMVFEQIRKHPGGTLPDKLRSPGDLKALYRLCACPKVTHAAILTSLRQYTLERLSAHHGPVLVLHDATELDYTSLASLADQLGQVGKGRSRGYVCHSSLAVDPSDREVLGLTNQILHRRQQVPKKESLPASRNRKSRESRLWVQGTNGLPADWRLVDVCDQGADTFEFLDHEWHSGRRFVIRSKRQRAVYRDLRLRGKRQPLSQYVHQLPLLGTRSQEVQEQKGRRPRRARTAELQISAGPVVVPRPHARRGHYGNEPLPMWAVRAFEPNPPKGVKPLEWVLLSNEPVHSVEDAMRILSWYGLRWVSEEWHKALKTGCGVENLQFTATARLEPMIAVLSAVATTLLNLRAASRREDAKVRPATDLVSVDYVRVLSGWRYGHVRDNLTIWEFFYALARLGGHQNRKHDKHPGWLVLWRGWTTLQAMLDGAEAIRRRKCG